MHSLPEAKAYWAILIEMGSHDTQFVFSYSGAMKEALKKFLSQIMCMFIKNGHWVERLKVYYDFRHSQLLVNVPALNLPPTN